MVYKRYIKRGGKNFGPYYYESYRDEKGVVRTRQVKPPKRLNKKLLFFILGFFVFFLILIFFMNFKLTSNIISKENPVSANVIKQVKEDSGINSQQGDYTKIFYDGVIAPATGKIYGFITGFVSEDEKKEKKEKEDKEKPLEEEIFEGDVEIAEEQSEIILEEPDEIILEETPEEEPQEEIPSEINETIINQTEEIPDEENETIINQTEGIIEPEIFVNETKEIFNETILEKNETDFIAEIFLTQSNLVIGKPAKWEKKIKVKEIISGDSIDGMTVELPKLAGNVSVKKKDADTGLEEELEIETKNEKIVKEVEPIVTDSDNVFASVFGFVVGITGRVVSVMETDAEVIVEISETIKEEDEIIVEYYTDAPYSQEKKISGNKKQITVIGPDEVHYKNILAYAELPYEVSNSAGVKLWHFVNGTKTPSEFEIYDLNNNSLYDYISWIVPHLSEQEYEIEISILNVQSYPTVGGNWTVEFTTSGTADLTITAVNETTWSNIDESGDLKFLEVRCGNEVLNYSWISDSVFIANYFCNETGYEVSKVLTTGKHTLEFDFGGQKAYAYNDAGTGLSSNIPQTFNLHGKLTDSGGDALSGTYNMTFKIYDSYTDGDILWESINQSVTTDADGVYSVILNDINLTFEDPSYLGITVESDSEMEPRINLTSTPYTHRAMIADDLNPDLNYTVANITASYFCNSTDCYVLSDLVGGGGGDNSSWNQTFADSLYASNANLNSAISGNSSNLTSFIVTADNNLTEYINSQSATTDGSVNSTAWNSTGDKVFLSNTSANVGIGTINPGSSLDVLGNIRFNGLNSRNATSYSNSIFNFAENVTNLGAGEYKVMTYEKQVLKSTNSPDENTVSIAHWVDSDVVGGEPNHIVSLVGIAGQSSNVSTTFVGTEGKAYLNTNGSTGISLFALGYLNDDDNTGSTIYGVNSAVSALQGAGTGTVIGGAFSATGGSLNYDLLLTGSKNIGAWDDAYSGLNSISFSDTNILLSPLAWVFTTGVGMIPFTDSEDYLGYTGFEWLSIYTNNIRSDTGDVNFDNENITTTGNVSAGYFLGDGSYLTGISEGNSSFNESRTDFLYYIKSSVVNMISGNKTIDGSLNSTAWNRSVTNVFLANSGDNVGVGTIAPDSRLHVAGRVNLNNTLYVNETSGKVGIGTASPSEKLSVAGNVTLTGNLVVQGSDIYDDGGNLRLNAEDNVYVSMDYNNDDADTNAIIFGKNDEGGDGNFVELMRINESGNVGIGTSSPGTLLDVEGNMEVGASDFPIRETNFGYSSTYKVLQLGYNDTANRNLALNIDPSTVAGSNFGGRGQILIPKDRDIIAPDSAGTNWVGVLKYSGNVLYLGGPMSSGTMVGTGLSVASDGNVGIGTSPSSFYKLYVYGNVGNYLVTLSNDGNNQNRYGILLAAGADDGSGTTYYINFVDGDGTQVGYCRNVAGAFACADSSDIRLKTNIESVSYSGIDIINQLDVIEYNKKDNPDGPKIIGLSAQEVEKIPELALAVSTYEADSNNPEDTKNDGMKGVSYEYIWRTAGIKAIQELSAQNEQMNQTINTQGKEIELLKETICNYHPEDSLCKTKF
ncbi:MAG: tail fiber domain-containing protein [archaeon]